MVKVLYPQVQYATEWKLPQPGAKLTQALYPMLGSMGTIAKGDANPLLQK